MRLEPGSKLAHYEVLSSLGAGGMGEVYRARDTKLGRDVAIKLLLDEVSSDPDRLARFEREARVLASLNHPNVATLHGLELEGETSFLVMELVEGETLADRIARGPIPLDEAIPLFVAIAEGLEAAHEKGVVHRDLKPANIKLGQSSGSAGSRLKILDFGLAKAMSTASEGPDSGSLTASPTMTLAATQRGMILGTAAYMSPEQAMGREVDRRTDIWAFGCCLFEALVGRAVFGADTQQQTMARILEREPALDDLPASTPPLLRRLLRRCLAKDPRQRMHDIGDVRLELSEDLGSEPVDRPGSEPGRVRRLSIRLPAGMGLQPASGYGLREGGFALSPDGTLLVYVARLRGESVLVKRRLDRLTCEPLSGTEGAWSPFFSPDGQQVGFFDSKRMLLKRVSVRGGRPRNLCLAEYARRGIWGRRNTIYFSGMIPSLARVPAEGGEPEKIDLPDEFEFKQLVAVVGDDETLLLNLGDSMMPSRFYSYSLRTGELDLVSDHCPLARYLPTGHVLTPRRGSLLAHSFDLARRSLADPPVAVEDEGMAQGGRMPVAWDAATDGTLVYALQSPRSASRSKVIWVDREGHEEELRFSPPNVGSTLQISPDGTRAAWGLISKSGEFDVWTHDLTRGTSTRITFHPAVNTCVAWTPDGRRLIFCSQREGAQNIYWKSATGAGHAERLTTSEFAQVPFSVSADGRTLFFAERGRLGTGWQLWSLPLDEEERTPVQLLESRHNQLWPALSPDGRWLAYVSDESGREEVYVQSYPAMDEKWQISTDGGAPPVWRRDGKELFYMRGGAVMAVPIETDPDFRPGVPVQLFESPDYDRSMVDWLGFDVAQDGQRFMLCKSDAAVHEPIEELVVVENWLAELESRVPTS